MRGSILLAVWIVTMTTCAAHSASAQIVTENAGVVSPETPILRESFTYLDGDHAREFRWSHQLILATDPSREFRLTVPTSWKQVEFAGPGGQREEEELFGLGDLSLRFKQSLWQRDDVMESTRWAALAEVVAPTGEDDEREGGAQIPRRLQLGTGDWTLGAGSAFTVIRDRQRFSAEAYFRHRTPHEGTRFGQTIDLNLAWWCRIKPVQFAPDHDEIEVRGVLELLDTYRFSSQVGGRSAGDDGLLVWIAPGLQVYPSKTFLFEANVQVPVFQNIDDALGDRHVGATLVIKFLF